MNLQELGSLLKQERERRGLSVRDVMDATKISRRNLNALEDGEVKLLPHPVYLKGYVRNYARLVGLDAEPLGALVDQQWDGDSAYVQQTPTPGATGLPTATAEHADGPALSGLSAQPAAPAPEPEQPAPVEPQLRFPKPEELTPRPRKKVWPWVVLVIVVLGVFGLVQQCRRSAPDDAQPLANATEANATQANATDANATDGNASLGSEEESYLPPEVNATAPAAALAPTAPVPTVASTAAPATQGLEQAAELRTPGMQELVVIAKPGEICWVEVSEGQRRKTFTIRDGDSRRFEFSRNAKVRLGNAGGVSFRLNGSHYPYDGQRGQTASIDIGAN